MPGRMQVVAHKDIITDISFSGYSCAANGSLSAHLNTSLLAELKQAGVKTHPLVGCGMPTLRTLFASPEAFISAAVQEATAHGFDGYNLDFEPYGAPQTNADGADYAKFLDKFAVALHKEKKALSVDFFSNLPIWVSKRAAPTAHSLIHTGGAARLIQFPFSDRTSLFGFTKRPRCERTDE